MNYLKKNFAREHVHNFHAGPATLPAPVMEAMHKEFMNYNGIGASIIEISHRSELYQGLWQEAKERLKKLLEVPATHEVLFLQGGARLQFVMVPQNLSHPNSSAAFIDTGLWSRKAFEEAETITSCQLLASSMEDSYHYIPSYNLNEMLPQTSYLYICSNNTVYGTQWHEYPDPSYKNVPLVADMSSDLLTRPVDIGKFSLVFACSQKNLGPAGITVVILRKDLALQKRSCPVFMDYKTHLEAKSLYNTPATFTGYAIGKMLAWIESEGGVSEMGRRSKERSSLLYEFIDSSHLFECLNVPRDRSTVNAVFDIKSSLKNRDAIRQLFLTEAEKSGFLGLAGHGHLGGLRASMYTGLPVSSALALRDFLHKFSQSI